MQKLLLLGGFVAAVHAAPFANPCNGVYSTEAACDKDAKCTWCKSAAVPSSCNTLADAKTLPPGVFACDKKLKLPLVKANPPPPPGPKCTPGARAWNQTQPCGCCG